MDEEALVERGCNRSLIHIDWMIGSGAVDVDGVTAEDASEPLMRSGEWAS
jgi:aminopeptidase